MIKDRTSDIDKINSAIHSSREMAWHDIYNEYYGVIKHYLIYKNAPENLLEDFVHQTFLRLVNSKNKPVFKHQRQFKEWLIKTSYSVFIDHCRRKTTKNDEETKYLEDINELEIDLHSLEIHQGLNDENVRQILNLLPERDHKILIMRVEGTKYRIIAKELNIKENAARTYFQRAVKKFRELYLSHFKETINER